MKVYRIGPCNYIHDLRGAGAFKYGGRWNSKGVYMLYTSSVASLAMLETVAHGIVPKKEYCLATLELPETKILELKEFDLPTDWYLNPAPDKLKQIGNQFIYDHLYLALKVPSAVFRAENNILINPNHPDFNHVKLVSSDLISADNRLLRRKG